MNDADRVRAAREHMAEVDTEALSDRDAQRCRTIRDALEAFEAVVAGENHYEASDLSRAFKPEDDN